MESPVQGKFRLVAAPRCGEYRPATSVTTRDKIFNFNKLWCPWPIMFFIKNYGVIEISNYNCFIFWCYPIYIKIKRINNIFDSCIRKILIYKYITCNKIKASSWLVSDKTLSFTFIIASPINISLKKQYTFIMLFPI